MVDSPRSFSLFKLPDKALKHVARCLDHVEILCLSIVTKRTKQLIKSLNIPNGRFTLEICDDVNIVVPVLRPLQVRWNYDDIDSLSIHTTLGEDFRDVRPRKLTKEGFHLGDWIRHLLTIFNHEEVKRMVL
ncbi:hypothetical protein GCK72_008322 [Caenorhabditis remanei]|uniref:F-box domain-containing protein n=1 Tax=Caenorhabditis remanei TaxID=31234 RepID=A0A6A5GZY6_CAERE|nr:hypothetical protein GCK72_008322 [Caenorhabditis remanei]KAF1760076.1 hypothetical protein GCK72_008322 [Caenorhabditis remanei]